MRNDHAAFCDLRRDVAQALGNVFVGKAVKAVTSHAFLVEVLRDGIVICEGAMAAMKRRIEAGNLRQLGSAREKRADRREIVGLMQRRERNVAFKSRNNIRSRCSTGLLYSGPP